MLNETSLPKSTVTILFTDIKNSTVIARALGDGDYVKGMRNPHYDELKAQIEQDKGIIFQDKGDGVVAYFPNAALAVAAAVTLQTRFRVRAQTATDATNNPHQIQVRMGLHTGESDKDGKPGVNALNYTSRIEALADADQIILSETTYKMLCENGGEPPFPCKRWPDCPLKGVETLETVYELDYDGKLRPEPGTRFLPNGYSEDDNNYIAREAIEKEVMLALDPSSGQRVRLVTLHAEGGMGKTRLAMACAKKLTPLFPQGARFVSLANTPPAREAVAKAIATALNLPDATEEHLTKHLHQSRGLLLILDNVESVHSLGVISLISALLAASPELRLLATGREKLRLDKVEKVISLEEGMSPGEARDLFLDRAAMKAKPPSADDPALSGLLKLTEYIPLAIELLAAWWCQGTTAATMTKDYAQNAQGRLTGTTFNSSRYDDDPSDDPAKLRHRSLVHSLNWSWDKLGEIDGGKEAQQVLSAISLFDAPFDEKAAAAVTEEANIAGILFCLQSASLVRRSLTDYTLHRFIRTYLREKEKERVKLLSTKERNKMQKRQAKYFLDLAEETVPFLKGADPERKVDRLEAELQNLNQALDWCAKYDVPLGLRVATDLWRFWWVRGYAKMGMERLISLLKKADNNLPARAEAASVAGHLARHISDRDFSQAEKYYAESLEAFRQNNDLSGAARVLRHQSVLAWHQGQGKEARTFLDEALSLSEESGKLEDIAETHYELGNLARFQNQYQEAEEHIKDSLNSFREAGDLRWTATALLALGNVTVRLQKLDDASSYYAESLKLFDEIKDKGRLSLIFERIAAVAQLRNRPNQAVILISAADRIRKEIGTPLPKPDREEYYDQLTKDLKQALGSEGYQTEWGKGRSMSLTEAVKTAGEEVKTSSAA